MAHVALIPTCHKSSSPHISTDTGGALAGHRIDISAPNTLPQITHYSEEEDEDEDPTYDQPAFGGSSQDDPENEHYYTEFIGNDDDGGGTRLSNLHFLASPTYWACAGMLFTLGQAVTALLMLLVWQERFAGKEAGTPLWIWLVGYTMGCITSLPVAAWKLWYTKRQQQQQQNYSQIENDQNSLHHHHGHGQTRYRQGYHQHGRNVNHQDHHPQQQQMFTIMRRRRWTKVWAEKLEMSLDFFFAVWFVLGNVWVFGRPSLALQSPSLYRLCVAFLALSCVSYALPFLVCTALCCCYPFFRSDGRHGTPPASPTAIAVLPSSRFKQLSTASLHTCDEDYSDTESNNGSGYIDTEDQTQRLIQADDAVCCICLKRYRQDIEIRTLPCSHHFHLQCVDRWLQIKAICPLCKTHLKYNNIQCN